MGTSVAGVEIRYAKTAKGIEEVENRSHDLPRRLRAALLLVFASKSEAELRAQSVTLGAPEDFLETLLEAGYIERLSAGPEGTGVPRLPVTEAARFIAGTRLIENSVANEAGLKSFFFQMKLRKCSATADLLDLAPAYRDFMSKHVGPEGADVYVSELRRVLGASS